MSQVYNPIIRAYRSCGFHNHTLAELREDPSLQRHSILTENDHLAHVPNIFGTYVDRGITYHTSLALVGIDDPFEGKLLSIPSRGISVIRLTDVDEAKKIWEFQILIPKNFCKEEIFAHPEADPSGYAKFCSELCDRTSIFAMEFLCCYRFFIEQVLETYQRGNSAVTEPVRDHDKEFHPKQIEAESLICTFDVVARNLDWFKTEYPDMGWNFDSIQEFLGLHLGRNRTSMWPYYKKWLIDHRVASELVEKKTMEYISMTFLTDHYEN